MRKHTMLTDIQMTCALKSIHVHTVNVTEKFATNLFSFERLAREASAKEIGLHGQQAVLLLSESLLKASLKTQRVQCSVT